MAKAIAMKRLASPLSVAPETGDADRLTMSIRVPSTPPAENGRGFIKAISNEASTGLLTVQFMQVTSPLTVDGPDCIADDRGSCAGIDDRRDRDLSIPLESGRYRADQGVTRDGLRAGLHVTPASRPTTISVMPVGKVSAIVSAPVVAPPSFVANSVQTIGWLIDTGVPESGLTVLVTTRSVGTTTDKALVRVAAARFANDVVAGQSRQVGDHAARVVGDIGVDRVSHAGTGAHKRENSFNAPVPELISQDTSPIAEQVQKNDDNPAGMSSTSCTELATLFPMLAKLTV